MDCESPYFIYILILILNIIFILVMYSLFQIYGVLLLMPQCWRGEDETDKNCTRMFRIVVSNIALCNLQTTLCVILTLVVWELAMQMLGNVFGTKYNMWCSQASHLGLHKLCAEGFVERRFMQSSSLKLSLGRQGPQRNSTLLPTRLDTRA
jgi:hypothetical protein